MKSLNDPKSDPANDSMVHSEVQTGERNLYSPGGQAMSDILIEQALDFYKEGDKQRAGALLKEVIEYDPGHIDALYGLSLCTDQPEEKANYLKQILALNPDHAKAQQALSRLEAEESTAKPQRRSWFKLGFGKKN